MNKDDAMYFAGLMEDYLDIPAMKLEEGMYVRTSKSKSFMFNNNYEQIAKLIKKNNEYWELDTGFITNESDIIKFSNDIKELIEEDDIVIHKWGNKHLVALIINKYCNVSELNIVQVLTSQQFNSTAYKIEDK